MTDNTYNIIHSHADEVLHSDIYISIYITVSTFKVIIQTKTASGNTSISITLHRSNKTVEECLHFPPISNTGGICRNNQSAFWEKYSCLKVFKYDQSLFM